MSEKEPKIYQEQLKASGKLTPEEIKEMVEKFKKEHKGLLPEYFSLPGEEKEEEREYPEELLIYYEMKEKFKKELEEIEQGFKNETLRENMIKQILSHIQEGQKEGKTWDAWWAFYDYSFLLSYPEFNEIKKNTQIKLTKLNKD